MSEGISVIIPLLNKGPDICRAIKSVLTQTVQNFEIIIMDGGSKDNGPEIVKKIDDNRIKFFTQTGKGVSNARNEAINFAIYDFIAFLDADDEWMPKHLETIIRLIKTFPDAGMYTTAYKIQSWGNKIRWANYKFIPDSPWEGLLPDYFMSGAMGEYPVWTSVAVIPKTVFSEMNGFPEGSWWGEDADLFGKIALKYPIAFSWEIGAVYHWDASNRTCSNVPPLDYEEPIVKTLSTALVSGRVPPRFIESINEYIFRKEIFRASQNILAGNTNRAEEILKKCETKRNRILKTKWVLIAKIPPSIILFSIKMRMKVSEIIQKSRANS